jgi:predicted acylesterase/phospholipase RssA
MARRLLGIAVGLALGGGGARAAAHLGVLQVLEQEDIPIDLITGTSGGAIIGGGYAMGRGLMEGIERWRRETRASPFRRYALSKTALFSDRHLEGILRRLFEDARVEHLALPFFAVATDLKQAVAVGIDRGPLWQAVRASCALPGAVSPVSIGEAYLVDGGVADNVPADIARARGARFVIAVDIGRVRGFDPVPHSTTGPGPVMRMLRRVRRVREFLDAPSMVQVIMRAMEVQGLQTVEMRAGSWNVRIHPDVSAFSMFDFGSAPTDALMARGREAAEASVPDIKAGLRGLLDRL